MTTLGLVALVVYIGGWFPVAIVAGRHQFDNPEGRIVSDAGPILCMLEGVLLAVGWPIWGALWALGWLLAQIGLRGRI